MTIIETTWRLLRRATPLKAAKNALLAMTGLLKVREPGTPSRLSLRRRRREIALTAPMIEQALLPCLTRSLRLPYAAPSILVRVP